MNGNKSIHPNEFFTSSIVGTPFQLNLESTSETMPAPKRLQDALSFDFSSLATTQSTRNPQKPLRLEHRATAHTPLSDMEKPWTSQKQKTRKSGKPALWLPIFLLFLTLLLLGMYTWK